MFSDEEHAALIEVKKSMKKEKGNGVTWNDFILIKAGVKVE